METKFFLQAYEDLYINTYKSTFPKIYFENMSQKQRQERALQIIRFAIEKYLQWKPSEVKKYLTQAVIQKLKLFQLLKYINFPSEYSKDGMDLTYLAYLLYPHLYKINTKQQCINMYKRICDGEISKFPSEWIDTVNGIKHFALTFQYVLTQMPRFKNVEQLYAFFAGPKAIPTFKKYKIYTFAITLYPNVFTAVHNSLPEDIKSDFLFHYYMFQKAYNRL